VPADSLAPGLDPRLPPSHFAKMQPYTFMLRRPLTQGSDFVTYENYQPIYKLHGSFNWFSEPRGERLLVIGGNKTASIGAFQVLAQYHDAFRSMLSQPNAHLMVIGYGFGDAHINSAIQTAADKGLKMFIIDTLGVDVIDE
jgi:SIR2-like domain